MLRRVAFPVAAGVLALAQAAIIVPGLFSTRLWEDEAYNLTVPFHLLAGQGYASDGILAGGGPLLFDPRISTGPPVLLPVTGMLATGIDPVLGGRIVMALFYLALLVGLWLLGRRIAGVWGALAAVSVTLALNTNQLPSPIQGPTDIVGELPAAAFLVFALWLYRRHPLWAGLLAGLAVQTKFIAWLAVPAVLLAVFLSESGRRFWARVLRALCTLAMVLVPTVLVELWKLLALGPAGYLAETRAFGAFVLNGGQQGYHVGIADKLGYLAGSWFLPWWGVAVLALAAVTVAVAVCWWGVSRPGNREMAVLSIAAAVGVVLWQGWFVVSAHTPAWIRYPAPGLIAFLPVFAAFVVLGLRRLWSAGSLRWVGAVAAAVLVVAVGVQTALHVGESWTPNFGETLADQRQAASSIASLGEAELQSEWGPPVSVVVLSGATSRLTDATDDSSVPLVLTNIKRSAAGDAAFEERVADICGRVLLRAGHYLVCLPADTPPVG